MSVWQIIIAQSNIGCISVRFRFSYGWLTGCSWQHTTRLDSLIHKLIYLSQYNRPVLDPINLMYDLMKVRLVSFCVENNALTITLKLGEPCPCELKL